MNTNNFIKPDKKYVKDLIKTMMKEEKIDKKTATKKVNAMLQFIKF